MKNTIKEKLQGIKLTRGEEYENNIVDLFAEVDDYYVRRMAEMQREKAYVLQEIGDFLEKLQTYFSFPVNIMGPVIADLFTLYKGQNYVYEVKENKGEYEYSVVNENVYLDKFFLAVYGGNITFYNYSAQPSYLIKYYPFIREFIDYVIDYRIENNIIEISEEILRRLLYDFIELHQDDIKSLYANMKGKQSYTKVYENKAEKN